MCTRKNEGKQKEKNGRKFLPFHARKKSGENRKKAKTKKGLHNPVEGNEDLISRRR